MRNRIRDESGAALVMALLITLVVALLATLVIEQSIHNTQAAGYNRSRLTSVNAAEAGLNHYFNYLGGTSIDLLTDDPITRSLGSDPGTSSFTVEPTYFVDEAGTESWPEGEPFTVSNYPKSVKLVSVGNTNGGVDRAMETFVVLSPVYGGLNGAVVANSTTVFNNNFTINGNNGNDGDVYVLNGDFTNPSGLEQVHGNIYVKSGSATIDTQIHLYGTVWAYGAVVIDHPQADIDGDAKSTTSTVGAPSGNVDGDAYHCLDPPPGDNVQGQKIKRCDLGVPPVGSFPQIAFDEALWTAEGFSIMTFSGATACTDARSYVEGTESGTFQGGAGVSSEYSGVVVRITDPCTYESSNNATISVGKNLAIVTDGGISLIQRSNWNGSGEAKLYFMSAWPTSGTPTCPTQDVYLGNNTSFNSAVRAFVYSPCTASMLNNNSAFQGQVIGNTVVIGNLFSMTYKPILVPGAQIVGFNEDIAYIREIQPD
ncbi:MAG TPA: pilus assembly PilX N-terminal domain-containing protein [Actinomycetota bacterium]|nr:pilus assembly PilX N-terminal domain-containing protein [Actinomycetota bacterium]